MQKKQAKQNEKNSAKQNEEKKKKNKEISVLSIVFDRNSLTSLR